MGKTSGKGKGGKAAGGAGYRGLALFRRGPSSERKGSRLLSPPPPTTEGHPGCWSEECGQRSYPVDGQKEG